MIKRDLSPLGMGLQYAGDKSAQRAIIVFQEAFGVNDHIRDVTERFAHNGFFAVAPEIFHRDGSIEVAYDNFQAAMGALGNLSKDGLTSDITETANYLGSLGFGPANIGVVGYCMGGGLSLYTNTLGLVGAAISFYGGGVATGRFGLPSLIELAPTLKAPWLGLYGDLDQGIPVDQVESLRQAARESSVHTEIVRYPNAQHGFHCDVRDGSYNAEDAADAATRTYEFLSTHLVDS